MTDIISNLVGVCLE